jgi:Glycosyltransferase 61
MKHLARLNPLTAPVLRRVLKPRGPEAEVLQPQEVQTVQPPVMLPGMLDRVTGSDEHLPVSYHIAATLRTKVTHAPVLRWTFRNAFVRRSGFATATHQQRFGPSREWRELLGPVHSVPRMRYCYNSVIRRYFGHWLADGVPSALIDPQQGQLWLPFQPHWTHAGDYLRALDLSVVHEPVVQADELIVYQDHAQGSHKRARYAAIRERLHALYGVQEATDYVYLQRGMTGEQRFMANEDAFCAELRRRNWKILDVATSSVAELQRAICRARVVVGIEGSQLNHAQASLRPGAVLVVLNPNDRYNSTHPERSRAHGVRCGVVVLPGSKAVGYHVNTDEVLRTIDLVKTTVPA